MSRDKQIEEMAKLMCGFDDEECEHCATCSYHNGCACEEDAKTLYNAGYRKSTDLAEEIFAEIEASAKVKYWRGGGLVVFEVNGEDFAELKKKYTEGGE